MTELIIGVLVGCSVAVIWFVARLRRPAVAPHSPTPLAVSVRARSADGALVKLAVEATVQVTPDADPTTLRKVRQAVEGELRQCLASRRVLALPGAGDTLTSEVSIAGSTVETVVVASADVEVTRELRRLVGGP